MNPMKLNSMKKIQDLIQYTIQYFKNTRGNWNFENASPIWPQLWWHSFYAKCSIISVDVESSSSYKYLLTDIRQSFLFDIKRALVIQCNYNTKKIPTNKYGILQFLEF